jgi:hypothetical protein
MFVQIIIVKIIAYYKKRLSRMFLAPNTSTSLQTLAVDAHSRGIIFIRGADTEQYKQFPKQKGRISNNNNNNNIVKTD